MDEQREDIIKENNTAQNQLISILENLTKGSKELKIEEALFGDIDFSILKELGYGNIKSIVLADGQITNIDGLSDGLLHFECPNNLLITLDELPSSLKTLKISFNHLTNIDISSLENLEKLSISHNKISVLENLPKTLIELECDNNKLERLDLIGLSELRVLNISNNRITLIENMPVGIVDFKMENTPSIEFRNSVLPELRAENKDAEEELKNHKNYIESLNEFFKLKNSYEINHRKMIKSAFKREPNKRLGKLAAMSVKPTCIKCKRPVGTLFSNRNDGKYTAICGDKENPCSLNIKLYSGNTIYLPYILNIFKNEIADIKDTIIRQKLDTLFSYVTEEKSVYLFKKEINSYNSNSILYNELLEKYNELFDNKHNEEMKQKKLDEIFILTEKLGDLLTEYKKTEKSSVLKTAMDLQINELYPEIRNMRLLQNEIIELNEYDIDKFSVFKYPVQLSKFDHNLGENPTVLKFQL
jgi:hypothetical protein